ncbi:MAG TPA: autotransporter-associated beta strand repeat-containing protein [Verrucomicrobiae bacterium]|nr:autotransporter-associated beta strand repeat-containing protein [Verrucomicrobiae bacterium]
MTRAQNLYWDANGASSGGSSNTVAPGTWGVNNFWSTNSAGTSATTGWTSGRTAVFSAGTNVTGAYTVNVSGNQTAGGITFQSGMVTLNGGTITLNSGAKITVNNGLSGIINSILAGTAGLTKAGLGTLTLNGKNTFTGGLTNSAGILILTSSNAFAGGTFLSAGTIEVGDKTALGHGVLNLDGGTLQAFNSSESLGNAVILSASSTIGGSNNLTFSGNFVQQGANDTLSVSNSALTTFSGSTFALASNGFSGTLTLNVSGSSGGLLISNTIQNGNGFTQNLTKIGNGTLTLAGSNTFTGNLNFDGGTLILGNNFAAGQGTLEFTLDGDNIQASGGAKTIANNLIIGGNITFGGTSALTFTDPTFALGGSRTFAVNNSQTTFTGIITGTSGQNFTKSGTGTLELDGVSTYVGTTTISQGTLLADNTTGSATGTNRVTVSNGATIGGDGIISGPLTLNSGATISPGNNAVGKLTTGAETVSGGATFIVGFKDVNSSAGVGWDILNILSGMTITASSGNRITLDLHSLTPSGLPGNISDFNPTLGYDWTIAQTTSGFTFNSGQNVSTTFTIETANWSNPLAGGNFSLQLSGDGKSLNLLFTPAPEPGACVVVAFGFFILISRKGFIKRRW